MDNVYTRPLQHCSTSLQVPYRATLTKIYPLHPLQLALHPTHVSQHRVAVAVAWRCRTCRAASFCLFLVSIQRLQVQPHANRGILLLNRYSYEQEFCRQGQNKAPGRTSCDEFMLVVISCISSGYDYQATLDVYRQMPKSPNHGYTMIGSLFLLFRLFNANNMLFISFTCNQ